MSDAVSATELADRLVAGAGRLVAAVRYCWLVIGAENSMLSRPMGHLPTRRGEDPWTIRLLTDLRSRKTAEIRRSRRATLIFQSNDDEAYASLEGGLRLIETAENEREFWIDKAYDRYFPTDEDRTHAGFIEVEVARIQLWIRGLTPEPFGGRTTTLTRDVGYRWICEG